MQFLGKVRSKRTEQRRYERNWVHKLNKRPCLQITSHYYGYLLCDSHDKPVIRCKGELQINKIT